MGRREGGAFQESAGEDAEPDFDLIQPRSVLGRVDKADAMSGVCEKRSPRRHGSQNAAAPLFAERIAGNAAPLGHVADDQFARVSVQVVNDEDPRGIGIRLNHAVKIFQEVLFRTRLADQRRDDLAGANVHSRDQSRGSMAPVLELAALHLPRCGGLGGGNPLQGLDARLFVNRDRARVLFGLASRRVEVGLADFARFALELFQIDLGRVQPVPSPVRLQLR